MEYQIGSPSRGMPRLGLAARSQTKFPDIRLQYHVNALPFQKLLKLWCERGGLQHGIISITGSKESREECPDHHQSYKKGKLTAKPRDGGGWIIDASELFRVWPVVSNVTDVTLPMLGNDTPVETRALERELELTREMLNEAKADRDSWKEQAQKITALIEDQRARKKGFWARLTGG